MLLALFGQIHFDTSDVLLDFRVFPITTVMCFKFVFLCNWLYFDNQYLSMYKVKWYVIWVSWSKIIPSHSVLQRLLTNNYWSRSCTDESTSDCSSVSCECSQFIFYFYWSLTVFVTYWLIMSFQHPRFEFETAGISSFRSFLPQIHTKMCDFT